MGHSLNILIPVCIFWVQILASRSGQLNSLRHIIKANIHKRILLSISTTFIPLSTYALPIIQSDDSTVEVSNLILCCGYLIEPSQYLPYSHTLHPHSLVTVPSPATNGSSILADADTILNAAQLMLKNSERQIRKSTIDLLLVGHSRGAAAAVAAFSSLIQSLASRNLRLRLVLLDPVDTAGLEVLRSLDAYRQSFHSDSVVDHRILIISTPYGGRSSYYKTAFTSSCAPEGRNADAFSAALGESDSRRLSMVTLPQFGHMQFLANRAASPFVDTCASSELKGDSLTDSDLIQYTQVLLQRWLRVHDETDHSNMRSHLSSQFPVIQQKWR